MTALHEELVETAIKLETIAERGREFAITQPLYSVLKAAYEVEKAWCGSWKGYHANVYYVDFQSPPTSRQFLGKWNLGLDQDDWIEFPEATVIREIYRRAEWPNLQPARLLHDEATQAFETSKYQLLSVLDLTIEGRESSFLRELSAKISSLALCGKQDFVQQWLSASPQTSFMTDKQNLRQQGQVPPHLGVI